MESESYPTTTRLLEPRRTTEHATPATQASGHRSVPASTGGRYFFPLPHASVRTQPRREERRPTNESELGRPRTQPRRFPTPHSTTTHSAGAAAVQSRAPPVSSSSSPTRHAHSYNDSLRSRKPFASYTTRNRPETDATPLAYQAFKIRSSTGTRQRGVQGSFLAGD